MKNYASLARFILLATLWGSSFTLIKVSLEGLAPGQLVLSRLFMGALLLIGIALATKTALPRSAEVWGHYAGAALFGNVIPFLLLSYGEKTTGAGIAGVLIGGTPLLTLTVATLVLPEERATARKAVGLVAGFAGVVILIGPWSDRLGSLGGQSACLGAALSYAVGFVYVRKFLSPRGVRPLAGAASQLIAATAIQATVTPFLEWETPALTGRVTVAVVALGLLSTGLAYILYFRLINDMGAVTASAVNYVVPVAAVAVGVLVLDEPVTWNLVAGGLVVLIGMGYAENRVKGFHKEPSVPAPDVSAGARAGRTR